MKYSLATRARGWTRRRLGLAWVRVRHRRAHFGPLCDIGRGFRLVMGRDAAVSIGPRCSFDRFTTLEVAGSLSIGSDTVIGHDVTIATRSRVSIGCDCLIAELVSIRDHDHGTRDEQVPMRSQPERVAAVNIESDVWLGSKVTVLRGVTIGSGTVVGANSVVTKSLPSGVVAAGVPARVIRDRK